MLPQLPFYGRELASLLRLAFTPRVAAVAMAAATVAVLFALAIVLAQLLTFTPPRIA